MRRDPRLALLAAATCLAGLALTGIAALLWPVAQAHDQAALHGFTNLDRGHADRLANGVAHLCDPRPYAIAALLLALVALARRRPRLALALPLPLVGAPATAEILKRLLATPRSADWLHAQIGSAAWPSGHATAACTLALCAVLVAPRRLRPAVAVAGAAFATAVSYAVLVLAWHFPSDVLGGFLVAAAWTLLAVAGLLAAERHRPEAPPPGAAVAAQGRRPVLWPLELAAAVGAALVLALFAARGDAIAAYASDHPSWVAVVAAIAALALGLATALERTLDREPGLRPAAPPRAARAAPRRGWRRG